MSDESNEPRGFISKESAMLMLQQPVPEGHTPASYWQVIQDWLNPPQAEEDPADAERERVLAEFEKLAERCDNAENDAIMYQSNMDGTDCAQAIRELIAKLRTGRD